MLGIIHVSRVTGGYLDLVTQLALDTRVLALDRARQRAGGGRGRVQEGDGGFVGVHVAAIDRGGGRGGGGGHLGQ